MDFGSCVFLLGCALLFGSGSCLTDLQQELLEQQQRASDGVIQLSGNAFQKFAEGKSRSYSLVFLLMAESFMDKPKLGLRALRKEFGLASQTYKEKYLPGTERAGKVFFVTIQLEDNRDAFQRLSVESLPFVFRLPPHSFIKKKGQISIPEEEKMTFDRYPDYPWKAEAFAEFVRLRTGIAVEEIPRNDFRSSRISIFFIVLFFASSIWSATRLYQSPILRSKWIWMLGSVLVCWFSTSGGMFNIIRGTPFVLPKDGQMQLLYPGNGQQLGAEGYLAGTMYVLFSGGFLIMTYGAPLVANTSQRRLFMLAGLMVALFVLRQIISFYKLKTGYPIQQYVIT